MRVEAAGLPKITPGSGVLELLYLKYKKLERCKVITNEQRGRRLQFISINNEFHKSLKELFMLYKLQLSEINVLAIIL